jgi:hypothetical protein
MASDACLQNPGSCDSYMIPYCKLPAGKADPTCACINSKLNGTNYLPMCSDLDCINGGYATKNMANAVANGCPSITNCNEYATYISSGLITNISPTQKQSCSSTGITNTSSLSTTNNTSSTVNSTAPPVDNTNLYIALGFAAFIILLMFIYLIRRR